MALGYAVAGTATSYATRVVAARVLGPEQYGLMMLSITGVVFAGTLATVGTGAGITRVVAHRLGEGRLGPARQAAVGGLLWPLAIGLMMAGLLYLFRTAFIRRFHMELLGTVAALLLLAVPAQALLTYVTGALRGFQEIGRALFTREVAFRGGLLALFLVGVSWLGLGLSGAVTAIAVSSVLGATVGIALTMQAARSLRDSGVTAAVVKMRAGWEVLAFSWPFAVSTMAVQMVGQVDTLWIGMTGSPAEVGMYQAALPLVLLSIAIVEPFLFVFSPVSSRLVGAGRALELQQRYDEVLRWTLYPVVLVLAVLSANAPKILTAVFGQGYVSAAPALHVLTVAYLVYGVTAFTGAVLIAYGHSRSYMAVDLVGLAVGVAANGTLTPRLGALGAALAASLTLGSVGVLRMWLVWRECGIVPLRLEHVRIVATLGILVLASSVTLTSLRTSAWAALAVVAIAGVACTLATWFLGGPTRRRGDLERLAAFLSERGWGMKKRSSVG